PYPAIGGVSPSHYGNERRQLATSRDAGQDAAARRVIGAGSGTATTPFPRWKVSVMDVEHCPHSQKNSTL
ncbi:MAG: hypothetical protein ACXVZQ_02100, partial [Terriglobales bacterium]